MPWKPLSPNARLLPFRAASAGSGRPNLLDKLVCRPTVAKLVPASTGRIEEPDAVLSGMTRSLHRRLTALNLPQAIRSATVRHRAA